jgi:hypothetical protein
VKRREPFPDLAQVLADTRPYRAEPAVVATEKRLHTRFDKAFVVVIGSELYGDTFAIARNVSAGGILVEMSYAPPLGTVVTVHFQHPRGDDLIDEIVVRAEVKHHHYLNYSGPALGGAADASSSVAPRGSRRPRRAVGMRFLEFVDAGDCIAADRLH